MTWAPVTSWSENTAPPSNAPSTNWRNCAGAPTATTEWKRWTSEPPSSALPPMLWSMWVRVRSHRVACRRDAGVSRFNGVVPPQACRDFVDVADSYSRRWQKALQHEKEQRHHLEETIEQLAKQHNSLERAWRENPSSYTGKSGLQGIPGPLLACRITACMLRNWAFASCHIF